MQVPKYNLPVTLKLTGQDHLPCEVYLAQSSQKGGRPETLDEFLNLDEREFIPVKFLETGRHIMVSKKLIEFVAVDQSLSGAYGKPQAPPTAEYQVRIELISGMSLEGKVSIYLDAEHARVSDLLNLGEPFIPIATSEEVIYVHRSMIRRVEELKKL